MTWEERYDDLDTVTCLHTPDGMELAVACARWYNKLEDMYSVNGDLEF